MLRSSKIRVVVLLLLAPACSSGPDIVATRVVGTVDKRDASILNAIPLVHGCSPGHYKGTFTSSAAPDSGPQVTTLDGDFTFDLVQTTQREFLQLADNSALEGTTSNLKFQGTITGGRACVEGEFETSITAGVFSIVGAAQDVPFDGTIHGLYVESKYGPSFVGEWEVFLSTASHPRLSGGIWTALLTSRKP